MSTLLPTNCPLALRASVSDGLANCCHEQEKVPCWKHTAFRVDTEEHWQSLAGEGRVPLQPAVSTLLSAQVASPAAPATPATPATPAATISTSTPTTTVSTLPRVDLHPWL